MDRDKKQYRQLKREIKKAGTRQLRRRLKEDLAAHPEEAHWDDISYDEALTSRNMNGIDHDSTRKPEK